MFGKKTPPPDTRPQLTPGQEHYQSLIREVLGPQIDYSIWAPILAAGNGPITSVPAETAAILAMRSLPSPVVIVRGAMNDPAYPDPLVISF